MPIIGPSQPKRRDSGLKSRRVLPQIRTCRYACLPACIRLGRGYTLQQIPDGHPRTILDGIVRVRIAVAAASTPTAPYNDWPAATSPVRRVAAGMATRLITPTSDGPQSREKSAPFMRTHAVRLVQTDLQTTVYISQIRLAAPCLTPLPH